MSDHSTIRYQGEVVEWSDEKRCGFVRPRGAKQSDPLVFVSPRSMITRTKMPDVGDTLIYELVKLPDTPQNRRLRTRYRAENTTFLGETVPEAPDGASESVMILLSLAYFVTLGLLGPWFVASYVPLVVSAVMSFITFATYWFDKRCAERLQHRVAEVTLQLLSLAGGWPGAAIAQRVLRHKTRKASFQSNYRWSVLGNLTITLGFLALAWYFLSADRLY